MSRRGGSKQLSSTSGGESQIQQDGDGKHTEGESKHGSRQRHARDAQVVFGETGMDEEQKQIMTPSELYWTMRGERQASKAKKRQDGSPKKGPAYNATSSLRGGEASKKEKGESKEQSHRRKVNRDQDEGKTPEIIELLNIADHTRQVESSVPMSRPLFSTKPGTIEFRNFQPFEETTQKLRLLNQDSVPRRVRVVQPDNPFFRVTGPMSTAGTPLSDSRVAPGVDVVFLVHFKPQECKDYAYDVVVVTEREKFVVPLRAIGPRPFLTFPDRLEFQSVAVKSSSTRTFVVQNIGDKVCQFFLSVQEDHGEGKEDDTMNQLSMYSKSLTQESSGVSLLRGDQAWDISPREGTVPVGGNMQITVRFTPNESRRYRGRLTVSYSEGVEVHVGLEGKAYDVNVMLDTDSLVMDNSYITLTSQNSCCVYNKSDMPVHYSWKAISRKDGENNERLMLCEKLQQLYERERSKIVDQQTLMPASPENVSEQGDAYYDEHTNLEANEFNAILPLDVKAKLSSIERKYQNLFRQVMFDELLFTDGAFKIEPLQGTIWAHSHQQFSVTFTPSTAASYNIKAFLEVSGRQARLPLQLSGRGIGPKAAFNFDIMDVGDIFVSSTHHYLLTMTNKGDIPAEWSVTNPTTPFGSKFRFDPNEGVLPVGSSQNIMVILTSDLLGEFSEIFEFKLEGSMEPLYVQFKGHVIGPTFHSDVDELDFGIVAYEFLTSRKFKLYNTSDTKFSFDLRVPHDETEFEREFDIVPPRLEIDADSSAEVTVDFVSHHAKEYDCYLAVDVVGVGRDLLSIPIKARCVVPPVRSKDHQIEFGTAYLGYPYRKTVRLVNDGDQPARYEVLPQEDQHAFVAAFHTFDPRGTIPPHQQRVVEFEFRAHRIGPISVPMNIQVSGTDAPLLVELRARGSGPVVEATPASLDWGKIPCLQDRDLSLQLENTSLISAPFKTFLKNPRSKFAVDVVDGVIEAGEKTELTVTAHVDDTIQHKDYLYVVIENSDSVVVPLKALGTGTTIYCEDDLETIDFGFQFTRRPFKKSFILENRGRRSQTVFWANSTAKSRESGRGKGGDREPEESTTVFWVEPSSVTLKPRTACVFSVHGLCSQRGNIEELLECSSRVADDNLTRVIFNSKVKARLIQPVISADPPSFSFEYAYKVGETPAGLAPKEKTLQQAPLTLQNESNLQLTCSLECESAFDIEPKQCKIPAKASYECTVYFDPGFGQELQSKTVDSSIKVSYEEHPHTDSIPVRGSVHFPNLEIEYSHVEFGHVLNDTTKSQRVLVSNCSNCPAEVSWSFLQDDRSTGDSDGSPLPTIPVNQVFDILPVRFRLEPYEAEYVEFAFYAHEDRSFTGTAVCEVEGGPTYEVELSGSGGSLGYELSRDSIDFGQCLFDRQHEEVLTIYNSSKVNFSYNVRSSLVSRGDILTIQPSSGVVAGNDKRNVAIKLLPSTPGYIEETLVLEVAHFEPIMVKVRAESIAASVVARLPRRITVLWEKACESCLQAYLDGLNKKTKKVENVNMSSMLSSLSLESSDVSVASGIEELIGDSQPSLPDTEKQQLTRIYTDAVKSLMSNQAFRAASRTDVESSVLQVTRKEILNEVESACVRNVFSDFLGALEASSDSSKDTSWWTILRQFKKKSTSLEKLLERTAAAGYEVLSLNAQRVGDRSVSVPERFVACRYVLDFGTIVAGSTKRKTCHISNIGGISCSFNVDSQIARYVGFRVEPTKVSNLPQGESAEFSVEYAAGIERYDVKSPPQDTVYSSLCEQKDLSKKLPLGKRTVEVPVWVNNGPSIMLELRANVCIPHVQVLQPSELVFGSLLVGQTACASIEIFNPCPITVSWKQNFPKVRGRVENSSFAVYPNEGTLLPLQHCVVDVVFAANTAGTCQSTLLFTSDRRAPAASIPVKGHARSPLVRLDPTMVSFGPCFPCVSSTVSDVTVVNEEEDDMEVFSLDFDPIALQETKAIEEAGSGGCTGLLMGDFRKSGRMFLRSSIDNSENGGDGKLVPFYRFHDQFPEDLSRSPSFFTSDESSVSSKVMAADIVSPRGQLQALDLIVIGPPLCGKTTYSERICKEMNLLYLTVDDCIDWARNGYGGVQLQDSLLNEMARSFIEQERLKQDRPESTDSAKKGNKKSSARKSGKDAETEEQPAIDWDTAVDMARKGTLSHGKVSCNVLASAVKCRFTRLDASSGVVVDGLRSQFADELTVLRAIKEADGDIGRLHMVNLSLSAVEMVERWKWLLSSYEEKEGDAENLPSESAAPAEETNGSDSKGRLETYLQEEERLQDDMAQLPPTGAWKKQEAELRGVWEEQYRHIHHSGSQTPDYQPQQDAAEDVAHGENLDTEQEHADESEEQVVEESKNGEETVSQSKEAKEDADNEDLPSSTAWMDVHLTLDGVNEIVSEVRKLVPQDDRFVISSTDGEASEVPQYIYQSRNEGLLLPEIRYMSSPPNAHKYPSLTKNSDGSYIFSIKSYEDEDDDSHRWIVPGKSSITFKVAFATLSPGQFNATLRFGIAGSLHEVSLSASGYGTWPDVERDMSRLVSRRLARRKRRPATSDSPFAALPWNDDRYLSSKNESELIIQHIRFWEEVKKQYVSDEGYLDIGSVPASRIPALRHFAMAKLRPSDSLEKIEVIREKMESANATVKSVIGDVANMHAVAIRLKNPGAVPCTINVGLLGPDRVRTWRIQTKEVSAESPRQKQDSGKRKGSTSDVRSVASQRTPSYFVDGDEIDLLTGARDPATIAKDLTRGDWRSKSASAFLVEPSSGITLEPDESTELFVWAFPPEEKRYENTVVITAEENPEPLLIPVACTGASSHLSLQGSWHTAMKSIVEPKKSEVLAPLLDAAQTQSESNESPKVDEVSKKVESIFNDALYSCFPFGLVDFGKLLKGNSESKSFSVVNSSLVSIDWCVDPTFLTNYPFISVTPSQGVLEPGETQSLRITYTTSEQASADILSSSVPIFYGEKASKSIELLSSSEGNDASEIEDIVNFMREDAVADLSQKEGDVEETLTEAAGRASELVSEELAAASQKGKEGKKTKGEAKGASGKGKKEAAKGGKAAGGQSKKVEKGSSIVEACSFDQPVFTIYGGSLRPPLGCIAVRLSGETYEVQPKISMKQAEPTRASSPKDQKKGKSGTEAPAEPVVEDFLDFGSVRVSESVLKSLTIENTGKYDMKVLAGIGGSGKTSKHARQNRLSRLCGDPSVGGQFEISPIEHVLQPQETITIEITFSPSQEVHLSDSEILELCLVDALSGQVNEVKRVRVSAFSYLSSFHFSPSKSLNFGALHCKETSTRSIQLFNDGKFEFQYELVVQGSERDKELLDLSTGPTWVLDGPTLGRPASAKQDKSKGKKGGRPESTESARSTTSLQTQAFSIGPKTGTVAPGESVTVEASFDATAFPDELSSSRIRFHISGAANASTTEQQSCLNVIGESCVPKVASDWSTIFEEHMIIDHEDDLHKTDPAARPPALAVAERKFDMGVISSSSVTSERFRLMNPSKVFASVKVSVSSLTEQEALTVQRLGPSAVEHQQSDHKSSGKDGKGGKAESEPSQTETFTVRPDNAEIAPYDSRYFDVELSASSIGKYFGLVQVTINNAPESSPFWFIVSCERTLPQVHVVQPETRASNGNLLVKYDNFLEGDKADSTMALQNPGKVPCFAHFSSSIESIQVDDSLLAKEQLTRIRAYVRSIFDLPDEVSLRLSPGERREVSVSASVPSDFFSVVSDKLGQRADKHADRISITCLCSMHVLNNKFARETMEIQVDIARNIVQLLNLPSIPSLWVDRQEKVAAAPSTEDSTKAASKGKKGGKGKAGSKDVAEETPEVSSSTTSTGRPVVLGELIVPQCDDVSEGIKVARENLFSDEGVCGYDPAKITIVNTSLRPIRGQWRVKAPFAFSPSVFHLPAGERMVVEATFDPQELGQFLDLEGCLECSFVTYQEDLMKARSEKPSSSNEPSSSKSKRGKSSSSPRGRGDGPKSTNICADVSNEHIVTWSSTDCNVRYVSLDSEDGKAALEFPKGGQDKWRDVAIDRKRMRAKIWEKQPEPECAFCDEAGAVLDVPTLHQSQLDAEGLLPTTYASTERRLKLSAIADTPKYELSDTILRFAPTMMYRSRKRNVSVMNRSNISSKVTWHCVNEADNDNAHTSMPFSVSPPNQLVEANSQQEFDIEFAPVEVEEGDFKALCDIPALRHRYRLEAILYGTAASEGSRLSVDLEGVAQRPIVHVDLPKSDYFASGRRPFELPPLEDNDTLNRLLGGTFDTPLSHNLHVVEMTSLGVMVRNRAGFYVVNPTGGDYKFSWEKLAELNPANANNVVSPFKCKSSGGMILSGGRYEMVFEYSPRNANPVEAVYRLSVPAHGIHLYFLLVGQVREPCIRFDPPRVGFKKLLVGSSETHTIDIVNDEKVPFQFEFDQTDITGTIEETNSLSEPVQVVSLGATSGTIAPESTYRISVTFRPQVERRYNFNLKCYVPKRSHPLTLNVKGEGYELVERVSVEDDPLSQTPFKDVSPGTVSPITFGTVRVGEQASKRLTFHNQGMFPFEVESKLESSSSAIDSSVVSVSADLVRVSPGDQSTVEVMFSPNTHVVLEDVHLRCVVAGTRGYRFSIHGESTYPRVKLSSKQVTFGSCPVPPPSCSGLLPASRRVYIENHEEYSSANVSLGTNLQGIDHLHAEFSPQVLDPGDQTYLDLFFLPRETKFHRDTVQVIVDEKYPIDIIVSGEGVPLSLVPLHQPVVDFSAPARMTRAQKTLEIANQSRVRLPVLFCEASDDPAGILEGGAFADSSSHGIRLSPTSASPSSNQKVPLSLHFTPEQRFSPKSFQFGYRIQGLNEVRDASTGSIVHHGLPALPSLSDDTINHGLSEWIDCFSVRAGCHDVDVNLDTDALHFAGVCLGSQSTKQLRLANTGDIGITFKWDTDRMREFTISPINGFVSAHSDQVFDVTFAPTYVSEEIRYPFVTCNIDQGAPLKVALNGECVSRPSESVEKVDFRCKVRETDTKQINLPKLDDDLFPPSGKPIYLHPVVDSKCWSCPSSLAVHKQESAKLDVTFQPSQMTSQAEHPAEIPLPESVKDMERPDALTGSLFVSLPDGTGLLYTLSGQADAPESLETVQQTGSAKAPCPLKLEVKNWLAQIQRLQVHFSQLPETCTIRGPKTLELQALSRKTYSATFENMLEETQTFSIAFVNVETGEYAWGKCIVSTEKAAILSTYKLETRCRKPVPASIQIRNPLSDQGSLTFSEPICTNPFVYIRKNQSKSSERVTTFSLLYVPLKKTSSETTEQPREKTPERPASGQGKKGKQASKKGAKETADSMQLENLPNAPSALSKEHESAIVGIRSAELGDFFYSLQLKATAAADEGSLQFEVELGSSKTKPFHFEHYSLSAATYECRIDAPDASTESYFSVPSTVDVSAASLTDEEKDLDFIPSNGVVHVLFEPGQLGSASVTLILTSKEDKTEYRCHIRAKCSAPRPVGPLDLTSSGSTSIHFKNVLSKQASFSVNSDSSYFVPGSRELSLNSKGETDIAVNVDPSQDTSSDTSVMRTGKVVVRCTTDSSLPPWVFYLQHDPSSTTSTSAAAAAGGKKKGKK